MAKGLGRGFESLIPTELIDEEFDITAAEDKKGSELKELRITDVIRDEDQPRREFSAEAIEALAASIKEHGVLQPIVVTKEDGKYKIVAGERRWRASQIVGLENLPAYIREADDENLHAMALVENIQRQDLNAIEIALGMQRLIEECGLTQEAMADKVGKKRSTVSNYMRLLNLPNEVQLALKEGLITMGHAKAIAGIEADKQVWALKRCIKKALSVRQAEELARKLAEQPQGAEPIEEEYPESYSRLVEQLEPYFSDNISIKRGKSGGGKIVIDFANDEEIEQFIERLRNK